MVLVLTKCGKINNTQVARSTVTAVLRKLSQLSRKSCDSYPVTTVIRQLFALGRSRGGQLGDFRLLEHFMDLAEKW